MSNSAWYQKLWHKKMAGLQVKDDRDSAWAHMKQALDEQMPVQQAPVNKPGYLSGAKVMKLLSYLLPAALVISAGVYYALSALNREKPQSVHKAPSNQISSVKTFNNQHHILVDSVPGRNSIQKKAGPWVEVAGKNKILGQAETMHPVIAEKVRPRVEDELLKDPSRRNDGSGNYRRAEKGVIKKHEGRLNGLLNKKHISHSAVLRVGQGSLPHYSAGGRVEDASQTTGMNGRLKRPDNLRPVVIGNMSNESDSNPSMPLTLSNAMQTRVAIAGKMENDTPGGANIPVKPGKVKQQTTKAVKSKTSRKIVTPPHHYSIEAGLNTGRGYSGFYFGVSGTYAIQNRLLVNAGLRINTPQSLSGEFSHSSYYRPDSLPPFKIIDARKVLTLNIPVTLEYQLSKLLSIKAGPVIGYAIKQLEVSTKLGPIADYRDTVYHGGEVKTAMLNTGVNKFNLGFTGGLSLHISRFDIQGSYQLFSPFKISNTLGAYSKPYQTFQVGIAYRFK